jgi:preprotein translocase subunit SecE
MSENNKDLNNKDKKNEQEKKSFMARLSKGISGIKGEFKRIIWPNKQTLKRETITVIATSLVLGGIIVAMDFVYNTGFNAFFGLLQ